MVARPFFDHLRRQRRFQSRVASGLHGGPLLERGVPPRKRGEALTPQVFLEAYVEVAEGAPDCDVTDRDRAIEVRQPRFQPPARGVHALDLARYPGGRSLVRRADHLHAPGDVGIQQPVAERLQTQCAPARRAG